MTAVFDGVAYFVIAIVSLTVAVALIHRGINRLR